MQITHESYEDRLVLHYCGELDHHAARQAMDYAENLAVLYPSVRFMLDLSGLTFMDSSGLAVVLNLYRILQAYDGSLWLPEAAAAGIPSGGDSKNHPL